MARLIILACSATKRHDPKWMPARDRYDGPLWKTLRAVDPLSEKAKVAFLSARYGFGNADAPIEFYNAKLTEDLAARMIAGGIGTRWPRPKSPRAPDNAGIHAGSEITALGNRHDPFGEVALVGGKLYLSVMRSFIEGFQRIGYVRLDARIVEINAPIGIMRQQMRSWLNMGAGH